MGSLTQPQLGRAIEAMRAYLSAQGEGEEGSPVNADVALDQQRVALIRDELGPLLQRYLSGQIPLAEFKSKVDSINKRHSLWGFKAIKGQMFFNMIVNVADDLKETDQELKAALAVPANEQIASSRIKTFASYMKRLGDHWVDAGNTRHGTPKVGSVPFFLSYFWQIQHRETWPVYYTSSVQAMTDLNLWQATGDLAQDFLQFKRIHEELADVFSRLSGEPFDLYRVEHVFWYRAGSPFTALRAGEKAASVSTHGAPTKAVQQPTALPESYVPPIIAILPRIARHDPALDEAARQSGITLDRAFEKYIDAAFVMLGYDTKLLGQGKGRAPDGRAVAVDDNYAILWDAKVRGDAYSMGTDDRTIREYITTQSRELKRRGPLRNIYYLVISSCFADDYDEVIRSIKMETHVNEVSLVEAEALVAMVDAKLRAPLQVTLGPAGLQRLFAAGGILTAETLREQLL